jgi:hypothetical protein
VTRDYEGELEVRRVRNGEPCWPTFLARVPERRAPTAEGRRRVVLERRHDSAHPDDDRGDLLAAPVEERNQRRLDSHAGEDEVVRARPHGHMEEDEQVHEREETHADCEDRYE